MLDTPVPIWARNLKFRHDGIEHRLGTPRYAVKGSDINTSEDPDRTEP